MDLRKEKIINMKKILFKIALLTIISSSLVGCATQKFVKIDKPIDIGNKSYTALLTERVNPWGGNAISLNLVESQRNTNQLQVQSTPQPAPTAQQPTELLTETHVVNSNNQGSIGLINGAFQGSVGDAIMGGGMMGAAALIRPSRVSANGGSGGQSSSMSAGGAGGAGGSAISGSSSSASSSSSAAANAAANAASNAASNIR